MRRHLTYANVMVTLLAIGALTGGVAYAADTIGSADVIDNSLGSVDLKNNAAVQSADVRNGTLNDEDVGQGTFVNFVGNIGAVPAHGCVNRNVTGINALGDHLLLTANFADAADQLGYSIQYQPDFEGAWIVACNPTDGSINDGATTFNLLVFDAQ
jgi:hypothetical protein